MEGGGHYLRRKDRKGEAPQIGESNITILYSRSFCSSCADSPHGEESRIRVLAFYLGFIRGNLEQTMALSKQIIGERPKRTQREISEH